MGNLEIKPLCGSIYEYNWVSAVIGSFKLKVPTSSINLGGRGKLDYLPHLILGQHNCNWVSNLNIGINIPTSFEDIKYRPTHTWCFETGKEITDKWTTSMEVFTTEDYVKTVLTALKYELTKTLNTFASFGFTGNDEDIFKVGFNLEFGKNWRDPNLNSFISKILMKCSKLFR